MSEGEETLAFQLRAAKISFAREWQVVPGRKFRFDFIIDGYRARPVPPFAVEVEGGSWGGGHKRGDKYDTDCEKHNLATLAGWRVLRFSPRMVESGEALATIEKALKDL